MVRTLALVALAFGAAASAQSPPIPSPGSGQPQPPAVPIIPVANPQQALAKLPAGLQTHLLAWEKKTAGLQTLYTECEREVTNTLTKKTSKATGKIYCMKPNLAYLKIENAAKKEDFSAYICDGKMVHEYRGADKIVQQHAIPAGGKGNVGDNLLLEFMSGGMTAADVAARFDLKLMKEDQHYIYIEAKALLKKDQQEFDTLILVLFNAQVKGMDYLPAKVRMMKNNNQEMEEWTFKQPLPNATNIKADDFRFVPPPKDWKVQPPDPQPKTARP